MEGAADADTQSVSIKRVMLERSRRSILLVDSSKFDLHQFELIGPLGSVNDVISERAPGRELARALANEGVAFHEAAARSTRGA